jgi:signal transduction histidine kinase
MNVRKASSWAAAVVSPVVLFVLVLNLSMSFYRFSVLGYLMPLPILAAPLLVVRRHPVVAQVIMCVNIWGVALGVRTFDWHYVDVVLYVAFIVADLIVVDAAARHAPRRSLPVGGLALATQLLVQIVDLTLAPRDLPSGLVVVTLGVLTAWLVGSTLRGRRAGADARRAHESAQAIAAERLRIARELHDEVAHRIGIIAIQAGMGRRVIDAQPGEARAALAVIEDTSRETLAGLRRTVGTLRRAESPPGLGELPTLAASTRDAGVRVELRVTGGARPVPDEVGLCAYRIVQEALTNVVRHAGVDTCEVILGFGERELTVEVIDGGRGGAVDPSGYGITGMRERAELIGGELHAGPLPGGGFQVRARLPEPTR